MLSPSLRSIAMVSGAALSTSLVPALPASAAPAWARLTSSRPRAAGPSSRGTGRLPPSAARSPPRSATGCTTSAVTRWPPPTSPRRSRRCGLTRVDAGRVALWFFSGGGLLVADWLRAPPDWLRCVAATYPRLAPPPDWDARWRPAEAVASAGDLPIVLTRAGLERPAVAAAVTAFVDAASDEYQLSGGRGDVHADGQHSDDLLLQGQRHRQRVLRRHLGHANRLAGLRRLSAWSFPRIHSYLPSPASWAAGRDRRAVRRSRSQD